MTITKKLLLASMIAASCTVNATHYFDWVFRATTYTSAGALGAAWIVGIKNGQINNNALLISSLLCTCFGGVQGTGNEETDSSTKKTKKHKPDTHTYAARCITLAGFGSLVAWTIVESRANRV